MIIPSDLFPLYLIWHNVLWGNFGLSMSQFKCFTLQIFLNKDSFYPTTIVLLFGFISLTYNGFGFDKPIPFLWPIV